MGFRLTIWGVLLCFAAATGCTVSRHPSAPPVAPLPIYVSDLQSGIETDPAALRNKIARLCERLSHEPNGYHPGLKIISPLDESVLPPEIAAPTLAWNDPFLFSRVWLIQIQSDSGQTQLAALTDRQIWTPERSAWNALKAAAAGRPLRVSVTGLRNADTAETVTRSHIRLHISDDPLGALVFYRQVSPVFTHAYRHPEETLWRLGDIASYDEPQVVLKGVSMCGNCHSFARTGSVMGIDFDFQGDKGAYSLLEVRREAVAAETERISWNECCGEDLPSMGLFSQISPDGRYIVSTVYEKNLIAMINNIDFSQLFLTLKGRLAVYDRREKRFFLLPGADRPDVAQTNPAWSPDGSHIVFARAEVDQRLLKAVAQDGFTVEPATRIQELNKRYRVQYDLYRIPFNGGRGGRPIPVRGASENGKSNYFAKYSPDGKWIVFTQSDSGILLQPDSRLYILPAGGGEARRMRCNLDLMNSWHSWSPNSRWLVFASKARSPFTELFLTHIDTDGNDSPPLRLMRFSSPAMAANIPELVAFSGEAPSRIVFDDH